MAWISNPTVPGVLLLLVSYGVLNLATLPEHPVLDSPQASGGSFEWHADQPDHVYLLEVQADHPTQCDGSHRHKGQFTHTSGLAHFVHMQADFTGTGIIYRGDYSVHAGPVNTAHVTGPLWAELVEAGYETEWFGSTAVGWRSTLVGAFESELDHGSLAVTCSGDDYAIRFFRADSYQPILLTGATGGAGAHATGLQYLGLNVADRYAIETSGSVVVLHVRDREVGGPGGLAPLGPHAHAIIRWPGGEEMVPLAPGEDGSIRLIRTWEAPGRYEVEFFFAGSNRVPLGGLLAGLVLEAEIGSFSRMSEP